MAANMIGNRYIVSKLIGEGGMADVYLAIDSVLKRQVAIKVLRGELNDDPVNLKRFQREANAITNLSHPNIVEVYDVGEESNRNYIVMEYVPGKTLKQLIKARGALHPDEAINIMKQLVSATSHAHRNGIIHRDIKSQNVLIKDDGTVKLSDFGIASTSESQQQLTQTDTVMGSVHYLAPELARGHQATVQSDIYSLGIVFYEMLTGNVPFRGDTAVQIALKHMHEEIPSVRAFNPDLPQSVENIVIRSTAKLKEDRYESADEMYNDLVTCLDLSRAREQKLVVASKVKQQQEEKAVEHKVKVKVRKDRPTAGSFLAVIGAIALCGIAVWLLLLLNGNVGPQPTKVQIPDVTGSTLSEAKEVLEKLEFVIETIKYEATEDVDKDKVIKTSPSAGMEVEPNVSVTIYVSSGKYYTVGNYLNQNINSVKGLLEQDGFTVDVVEVRDGTYDVGTIIYQSIEEGTRIDPMSPRNISFTVTTSVAFVIPTNLKGRNVETVKTDLENQGAVVKLVQLPIENNIDPETGENIVPVGTVVSVMPEMGTYYSQSKDAYIELTYY
ncbi:MAG: Stk1 family PASTA domain-containing Ser/Thr kinase [Erysipelotrichaceae bacterium]|nr:Stk1 family PASTA domain-containing Ser/Thr kinase [Erysipelotrichaceae bacterium]